MPVYMIRAGENGPVKIGWASSVASRLRTLQGANHERLVVLRTINIDRWAECELHKQFEYLRLAGEWFTFNPDMLLITINDLEKSAPRPGRLILAANKKSPPKERHCVLALRRWLSDHGETLVGFASRIGVAQSYLSEIVNEKKRPRLDLIDKITIATGNALTANDFQRFVPGQAEGSSK